MTRTRLIIFQRPTRIINVEVRVISRAEGEANNSYRDIDNFAYHKNRI